MEANNSKKEDIKRLTPEKIVKEGESAIYTIPIYQRLFEWDEEKIERLLNDLWNMYNKDENSPYYIGMLTAEYGNNNLVDGQQRFVVMMLLGIVMRYYCEDWKEFICSGNDSRLSFNARKKDEEYLNYLIDKNLNDIIKESIEEKESFVNFKMKNGVRSIYKWINDKGERKVGFDKNKFCKYVFKNLSFYISQLPEHYSKKDLNKYFERMNSAGKNLENYEILKVELLKNYDGNKDRATFIWNIVSDMDKQLIREKQVDKSIETIDNRRSRFQRAFQCILNNDVENTLEELNDKGYSSNEKSIEDNQESPNIESILKSKNYDNPPDEPKLKEKGPKEESILSFTEFLLIVLYIMIDGENRDDLTIDAFFDTSKLLEVYKKYLDNKNLSVFYTNLLKYRLIYDYFIIRKNNDEKIKLNYDLENIKDDSDMSIKRKFIQYQSMLYAGDTIKTYYRWLAPLMKCIAEYKKDDINYLLEFLKTIDNKNHECLEIENLQYGSNDLGYYLRRLDYYIWEKNEDEDSNKMDKEITYFNFVRGGRSVEHLHPQNQTNVETWDEKDIHRFGNLFLISSSFNSTQSNDTVNVKFARIKDQINKKNIESLKLYKIFKSCDEQEDKWNKETMKLHENEMYKILKRSYDN